MKPSTVLLHLIKTAAISPMSPAPAQPEYPLKQYGPRGQTIPGPSPVDMKVTKSYPWNPVALSDSPAGPGQDLTHRLQNVKSPLPAEFDGLRPLLNLRQPNETMVDLRNNVEQAAPGAKALAYAFNHIPGTSFQTP